MKTKICTKCYKEKPISEFHKKSSGKFGVRSDCKSCRKKYQILHTNEIKKYHKDYNEKNKNKLKKQQKEYYKNFPWKRTLLAIRQRCNNIKTKQYKNYGGRGIKCLITEKELKELWFRDKGWLLKKSSINRKDNDGNYTFENCEFIEFGKNSAERNTRTLKRIVLQFDKQDNFLREWSSVINASQKLNIKATNISAVSLKKYGYKSAGGYIWRYKDG
jgi:hypothetical protein